MDTAYAAVAICLLLMVVQVFHHLQARSDLTARAAQIPVLSEVKALEQSIAALLEQLRLESVQTSAQLEARCREARDLLSALDRRLEEIRQAGQRSVVRRRTTPTQTGSALPEPPTTDESEAPVGENRFQSIYVLADQGLSVSEIARQTGASQGEIELVLGVRASGTPG